LRRANGDEIEGIKRTVERLGAGMLFDYGLWEDPLEASPLSSPTDHRVSVDRLERVGFSLPKEDWRYYVVAYNGNNAVLNELTNAFNLSSLELEVGFTVSHTDLGAGPQESIIWNPSRLFHVLEGAKWTSDFLVDVSPAAVPEALSTYTSLRDYDHAVLNLHMVLLQMRHLKALPHTSPLRFLGYFGILESLLTHNPKPTDTIDSITRQVRTKLKLLNRRFADAINYSGFEANADTVWKRMYGYRSVIAHGGTANFEHGELAVLKSPTQAMALLKHTTKALIRHTLNEPQLILDLREC